MPKDEKLYHLLTLNPETNMTDSKKCVVELRKLVVWIYKYPNVEYDPLKAESLMKEIVFNVEKVKEERTRERERIANQQRRKLVKENTKRFKKIFSVYAMDERVVNDRITEEWKEFRWNENITRHDYVRQEGFVVVNEKLRISPNEVFSDFFQKVLCEPNFDEIAQKYDGYVLREHFVIGGNSHYIELQIKRK